MSLLRPPSPLTPPFTPTPHIPADAQKHKHQTITLDRLYEMDYNTLTDTYRLSDDFLPEPQPLDIVQYGKPRDTAGGGGGGESQKSRESQNRGYSKIGAWSPEVGIHRCVWNNGGGLGQAGWVGSGGASGVGRVEWVEGVWREK